MWRLASVSSAPAPPLLWEGHRRFLSDLFSVRQPETAVDLTHGVAAALVRELVPTVDLQTAGSGPVDLVLAERSLPHDVDVAEGGLVLVNGWSAGQTCGHPFAVLASGLGVVAPSGDHPWQWLLSGMFVDWSAVYCSTDVTSDERVRNLREALEVQETRITALERELLAARDQVQQLLPLEVSPKAQLRGLTRTVPVSVRKRLGRRRRADARERAVRGVDLRHLRRVSLAELLRTHLDTDFTGCSLEEYVAHGLRKGEPVNEAHALWLRKDMPRLNAREPQAKASTLVRGTSRSTGSLAELLVQAGPKLISVDVWDTLIVRDRPADSAKLATARRMVLNPAVAEPAQTQDPFEAMAVRVAIEARLAATDPAQEYELAVVLRETLHEMVDLPDAEASALVERLVSAEIADEIVWSHARPDVEAVAGWGDVVVASDFYMTAVQLQEILGAVSPDWKGLPTFVSVDRGCSKRLNGGLLHLIRGELGVAPSDHVHIGDNAHSDVAVQVAAGGMAIHVRSGDDFPRPGEFGVADVATCSAFLQRDLRLTDPQDPAVDPHELAGRVAAPLAVVHVARAIEEAYALGLDRVHYVSREGIFSSAVHEAVEPVLRPPGVRPVEAVHLSLSRRATFGASLQAPFRASLQRMWSMYAQQSVRAMLISIGVDPEQFVDDAAAVGLSLDEVVADARRDSRVERLLADPGVEARIEAHVHEARSLLRRYVLSRTTIDRPFIMADIGWRGTIQDNLVRALGIRQSVGVYLGLFPFLNAQPPGTRKIGVAFDANLGEDYQFADPPGVLERPWTPDVPSTIGFEEVDGVVVPLHDKESGHVSSGIAAFQRGALSAASGVAEWMVGFGFTASVLHDEAGRWARELWESPPEGLADIWFASEHDDSFGALNSTSFGKDAPGPDWLRGSLHDHVKRGAEGSGWPAGYLAWRPVRSLIELAGR